jgi:arginyl-tRNA synthetase
MARPEAVDPVLARIDAALRAALVRAGLPDAPPDLERPNQADHGDWATTLALRLAKPAGRPPREVAEAIVAALEAPGDVADVGIAGPGFVNLRLTHAAITGVVPRVLAEGSRFGRRERPDDERETVNLEFVSANPTGPVHLGSGRWAATGDALAALIEADGHRVVREYYVNDAGEQVRRFGESLVLVARGLPLGEDHYRGEYLVGLARELSTANPDAFAGDPAVIADAVGAIGVEAMRGRIEAELHRLGVDYDVWSSERSLHESGAITATIEALTAAGHTEVRDGATFLVTTRFGDDKDRVLVRGDGRPTYFAADCAYLRDKASRADRLFYLLGADHHGYVGRLTAAASCLGIDPARLEIRIGQLVNLLRDGEPVRLSKRAGEIITLDEVVEEVGVDVARYHFLRQSLDTTIDFDLAVVASRSMDNPVYYVQYAHARISSVVRQADERGFDAGAWQDADLSLLVHPAEVGLMRTMAQFPLVVAESAELRATQRMARHAEELAAAFHRFYTECRVLVAEPAEDEAERAAELAAARARYWLAVGARQVLANALGLLRVSAPERM